MYLSRKDFLLTELLRLVGKSHLAILGRRMPAFCRRYFMGENIIGCICALTIFALSYWFLLTRKDFRRPISRMFLYVLIIGTLSCVFNLICGVSDSFPQQYALSTREVIHGVYLVVHSLVAPFMAWYFICFVGTSHKLNTAQKVLFTLPAFLLIILPILIPSVRHKIYYFDENGVYQRGPYAFWTIMLGGLIYAVVIIATAVRNKERLSKEQKWAVGFLFLFFSIPTIIEVNVLNNQRISEFFEALGIFLVLLSVDNQNWVYHQTTHTYNRITAQRHIRGYINSGITFQVLLISISRGAYFRMGSYGSENFQLVLGMIGTFLGDLKTDVYYCEQGVFLMPVFSDGAMGIETLRKKIAARFDETWQVSVSEGIHLPIRITTVHVPEDVHTVEKLFNIVDYPYNGEADETIFTEAGALLSAFDTFCDKVEKDERESSPGQSEDPALPDELLVMLDNFSVNIAKLTSTERKVVCYYLDGYDIASLPDLMDISINTVRKHNRNIYQKLNVASREELMIYLDVLDRCGRLKPVEKLLEST